MSSFYKMDPAAWDFGTSDLSLEEEAAYLRIVNAINKHDAPVPYVDRVLAGMFRCSTRKARTLVTALIEAGKVYVEGGKIWNDRARNDVEKRADERQKKVEAGVKGSAVRHGSRPVRDQFVTISTPELSANHQRTTNEPPDNPLKTNEPTIAGAIPRIEENRREKKEEDTSVSSKKKRGSRLRDDWLLPRDWGEWAVEQGMDPDAVRAEADRFRDYWIAKAGREASKLDWQATWRNWIRSSIERNPRKAQSNAVSDAKRIADIYRSKRGMDCGPDQGVVVPLLSAGR